MYFPNAFAKAFLPAVSGGTVSLASTGTTASLLGAGAGSIGFFDAKTYAALGTTAQATPFIFAQASYYATDKIGPVHGGYQESFKSKVINPKYVSRVIKVGAKAPVNHIMKVDASACTISCDTTYRLRLDVKGSPALRFLNHQIYRTLDAYSGCCNSTNDAVDPNVILLQWKDEIAGSPILAGYINPIVWNKVAATTTTGATTSSTTLPVTSATGIVAGQKVVGTGIPANTTVVSISSLNVTLSNAATVANGAAVKFYTAISTATYTPVTNSAVANVDSHLDLVGAYVDTKFGNATFTPTDFYEREPIFIYASQVDEDGNPCTSNCTTVAETQTPVQVFGLGETVVRELILSGRYLQNAYPDSFRVEQLRMREIEADPALATVNRNGLYDQVLILHNVPRFYNPSATFDNDQYLIVIYVPQGTTTTAITNFIVNSAAAAGNSISLETA